MIINPTNLSSLSLLNNSSGLSQLDLSNNINTALDAVAQNNEVSSGEQNSFLDLINSIQHDRAKLFNGVSSADARDVLSLQSSMVDFTENVQLLATGVKLTNKAIDTLVHIQ